MGKIGTEIPRTGGNEWRRQKSEKRTHAVRIPRVELHIILVNLVVTLNTEVLALGELESIDIELLGVYHRMLCRIPCQLFAEKIHSGNSATLLNETGMWDGARTSKKGRRGINGEESSCMKQVAETAFSSTPALSPSLYF